MLIACTFYLEEMADDGGATYLVSTPWLKGGVRNAKLKRRKGKKTDVERPNAL